MNVDLEDRLAAYRPVLDDAIDEQLTATATVTVAVARRRRWSILLPLVGAVAAAIAVTVVVLRDDNRALAPAPVGTDPLPAAPTTSPLTATAPTTRPPAPAAAPDDVGGRPDAMAFGDSVMLGAAPGLATAGIVVDAATSRTMIDMVPTVQRLANDDALGQVVVVQLGTNGPLGDTTIDQFFEALRGVPRVIVLTVRSEGSYIAQNNAKLTAVADRYPNVDVVDWATLLTECPGDCFYDDGIHLKPDGRTFYTGLIVNAVLASGPLVNSPDRPWDVDAAGWLLPTISVDNPAPITLLASLQVSDGYRIDVVADPDRPNPNDPIPFCLIEYAPAEIGRVCPTPASLGGLITASTDTSRPGGPYAIIVAASSVTVASDDCDLQTVSGGGVQLVVCTPHDDVIEPRFTLTASDTPALRVTGLAIAESSAHTPPASTVPTARCGGADTPQTAIPRTVDEPRIATSVGADGIVDVDVGDNIGPLSSICVDDASWPPAQRDTTRYIDATHVDGGFLVAVITQRPLPASAFPAWTPVHTDSTTGVTASLYFIPDDQPLTPVITAQRAELAATILAARHALDAGQPTAGHFTLLLPATRA